jgi:hypothetical protein
MGVHKIMKSDCWLRYAGPSVRTEQFGYNRTESYEI